MSDIFDQVSGSNKGDIFDSVAPKKKSAIMQGLDMALAGAKYAGGTVVGAGEIAANLATQTYGLPARGYAEIANLATGRTDLPEKVSKALIYEPQTEQGKAGMDAIGGAFEWWNKKSMAVGTPVQEAVAKIAGETAGNVVGATVASTMEAAPLFVGGVFGKAKGKIAERRAAKDQAIIRDTLAKEKAKQSEADISRAYLGDEVPGGPSYEAALEKYGGDIFDRIQRGYLGDVVTEGQPKPFVAPQVPEYSGPRTPPPKQLPPAVEPPPVMTATPPAPPLSEPITQEATPTPSPAPEAPTAPPAAAGTPEFYKAEAAKLPGDVRFAGLQETGIPGRPPIPMFQDEGGAGSFILKPGETVSDALTRARARYETPKPAVPSPEPQEIPESFRRTSPAPNSEERTALDMKYKTMDTRTNEVYKEINKVEREALGKPYGSKVRNQLEKRLEKLNEESKRLFDDPVNKQHLTARLEDYVETGDALQKVEAKHRLKIISNEDFNIAEKRVIEDAIRAEGIKPDEMNSVVSEAMGYTGKLSYGLKDTVKVAIAQSRSRGLRKQYLEKIDALDLTDNLSRKYRDQMNKSTIWPQDMEAIYKEANMRAEETGPSVRAQRKADAELQASTEAAEAKTQALRLSVDDMAKTPSDSKKYYININGKEFEEVSGRSLKIDGIDAFIAKGKGGGWVVTEGKSGLAMSKGMTQKEAIDKFNETTARLPGGLKGWLDEHLAEQISKNGLSPRWANKSSLERRAAILSNERGSAPAVNAAAKQIKEFFVPLSTMPQGKAYLSLRYKDLLGGLTRVDRIVGQLSDRFKGLSVSDKADVFNAIRGEIPMDTLPAETQTIAKQTKADLNRTGQMLVRRGLLSKETFEANKDTYIHYLYLRHILPDDASIPIGKGGRLDLSYLKARKDLPESVRQELGLIEDVSVAAPVGMGKALGDIVKADFFKKVAANPNWVWQPSKEIAKLSTEFKAYKQIVERGENVGFEATAKYNQLKADLDAKSMKAGKAPADFVQLPDSPAYGELKGAFVRKEIANDIVPIYSANIGDLEGLARVWSHVGKGFDVGMTMFKVGKVALNPPTAIRNVFSNFIQMNMSGIPLYRVPDVVIGGVQSMIAKDKLFRTLERNGGFKTNFSVAELGEVLKTFQEAKGGPADKFFGAVTNAAKYYGKIDDIAKMSLFKDAVTRQGMSVPDAVQYAQKWGMDYSLASRSVKHGRRYALPFLSYQYKIAPLIAETLVTRPWVIAKYAAIPYLMAKYAAEKYDWTDKDLDKAQQMMKEKTQGQSAYMILPIKDNKGNIEIVNMEYFLPWGNWMEAARDLKGGNFIDTAKQFGGLLGPYGNVISMLNTKRQGEPPKDPFTGQPVYSKLDSPKDKYLKQVEWWWKLFGPSSFSSSGALGYTAKAIEGGKDKWGVEATGAKALGRWMGLNVGSLEPKSVMAARKFKIRELDAEIHRIYRDPKYSKEDRKNALRQLQVERKKILSPE